MKQESFFPDDPEVQQVLFDEQSPELEHDAPAERETIAQTVERYREKHLEIPHHIQVAEKAALAFEAACHMSDSYTGSAFSTQPSIYQRKAEEALLQSAWAYVYKGLKIGHIATAKDRVQIDRKISENPPFTLENISEILGEYTINPWSHVLRGLAEVFTSLDDSYKSHSKVLFGVEGLPKRIVFGGFSTYGGHTFDRLSDLLRAVRTYQGRTEITSNQLYQFVRGVNQDQKRVPLIVTHEQKDGTETEENTGFELQRFKNGNAHLWFDLETRKDINRALAEFYGPALADVPSGNHKRQPSTEVSKNLSFYRTPKAVTERMLHALGNTSGWRVLEPSCGEGDMIEVLAAHHRKSDYSNPEPMKICGIEYDRSRVEACKQKGFAVLEHNFLQVAPPKDEDLFDLVLMNPPFAGKHYQKHVEHAKKFLKLGGILMAVLPASARYDHDFVGKNAWEDLPAGSFRESGTNIPTGYMTYYN